MHDQEFELRLAEWLEEGPIAAPDRPIEAAIRHAGSHPRRRFPWTAATRQLAVVVEDVRASSPALRLAWLVALLALVLALAALAIVGSRPRASESPPGNGLIAFTFDADIWTVRPDGTGLRNLTETGDVEEYALAWSPDGNRLAFWSKEPVVLTACPDGGCRFRVEVMKADGSDRHAVSAEATGDGYPSRDLSWSPDGARLAYVVAGRVRLTDVDGGDTVTVAPSIEAVSVAFSPDGSRLALIGTSTPGSAEMGVYVSGADGMGLTRLALPPQAPSPIVSGSVAWGEGGRALFVEATDGLRGWLFRVDPDGSGLRMLVDEGGPALGSVVSPGGAVAHAAPAGAYPSGLGLYATAPDGGASRLLGPLDDGPAPLAWSPDGTRVALAVAGCRDCLAGIGTVRLAEPPLAEVIDYPLIWVHATPHGNRGFRVTDIGWQPVPGAPAGSTLLPTPTAVATPSPAALAVTGEESCVTVGAVSGDPGRRITEYRDFHISCGDRLSDPRVSGRRWLVLNIDYRQDGSANIWGTSIVANDGGSWIGSFSGTVDVGYTTHHVTGVETGTGDYEGLRYRFTAVGDGTNFTISGTIEPAG